jgi:hypothetical protein
MKYREKEKRRKLQLKRRRKQHQRGKRELLRRERKVLPRAKRGRRLARDKFNKINYTGKKYG